MKRHAMKGKTRIHGGKLYESVVGFDANALYLWAINQYMPTGPFIRRMEPDFKPEVRDRYMVAYYWMDFLMHTSGTYISHELNSGKEVRVGPYPVDGYQSKYYRAAISMVTPVLSRITSKTNNRLDTREKKYKKTQETTSFFQKHRGKVTEDEILKAVVDEELYGMVEVDITVPDQWISGYKHPTMTPYEYFQEMCPIFCNTLVPFESIGNHMKEHVEQHNIFKT
ncbi:hypothetical protein KUTeg_005024 [Tegillarca granosa]|uniref:DNA-directed DNA polymerase n=1 Tax=Tegillarca granosa TaxID=220873 RepID=A0ABQ9FIK5_TEGGR|nr:hypothetical protein KUTeg_005024 [Tegillarca granosa]